MEDLKAVFITTNILQFKEAREIFLLKNIELFNISNPNIYKKLFKKSPFAFIVNLQEINKLTPYKNYKELITDIRNIYPDSAIIILSIPIDELEIAQMLELGADDVIITKPNFKIILEEILSLFRFRQQKTISKKSFKKISLDDRSLIIDISARKVFLKNSEIHLTRNEFKIIEILVSKKGKVITYEEFRKKIWPYKTDIEIKHSLLQHITDIRKKLKEVGNRIKNIWGEGYRIE